MTLKNDVTYGDNDKKIYCREIKKRVRTVPNFIQVDSKDVYVIFTGWEVTSTASQSYLFKKGKQLMARDDVQEYINQLRAIANYETADLKARLTEKTTAYYRRNFYSKIYRSKRHRAITSSITFCSCASIKSFNGNVSSKGSTRK